MTVEELRDLLQKLVDEGKGGYQVRSVEFENHMPTKDYFCVDDENQTLWYDS